MIIAHTPPSHIMSYLIIAELRELISVLILVYTVVND